MMKYSKFGFVACMLATALTFNSVVLNAHMAYAETTNSQFVCGTSNEEISPDRIVYAQVDVSCFTNLALDYVDEYVATNEVGEFYITDCGALQELLTPEQYFLVEEQIEAVNGSVALYEAEGAENNPVQLEDGVTLIRMNTSSETWFSCQTRGATDFRISSQPEKDNTLLDISVYKKKLFGKQLIQSAAQTRYYLNSSDPAINNNHNTYLVQVIPRKTTAISVRVEQHCDRTDLYKSTGATWRPFASSAIEDTNILYYKYWYATKDDIQILLNFVDDDKFIEYQQMFYDGTLNATKLAAMMFPTSGKIAVNIITFCCKLDFKGDLKSKIKQAAGFVNGKAQNGVLMIEYMYTPQALTFHDVETWNGGTMSGPEGWNGYWTSGLEGV